MCIAICFFEISLEVVLPCLEGAQMKRVGVRIRRFLFGNFRQDQFGVRQTRCHSMYYIYLYIYTTYVYTCHHINIVHLGCPFIIYNIVYHNDTIIYIYIYILSRTNPGILLKSRHPPP